MVSAFFCPCVDPTHSSTAEQKIHHTFHCPSLIYNSHRIALSFWLVTLCRHGDARGALFLSREDTFRRLVRKIQFGNGLKAKEKVAEMYHWAGDYDRA